MRSCTRPFASLCISAMLAIPVIVLGHDSMVALFQDDPAWKLHAGTVAEHDDAAANPTPDRGLAGANGPSSGS